MTPTKECGCGKWSPLDAVTCRCGRLFVEARASHEVSALQTEVSELRAALEAAERERDEAYKRVGQADAQRMNAMHKNEAAWAEADELRAERGALKERAERTEEVYKEQLAKVIAERAVYRAKAEQADALKEQVEAAREDWRTVVGESYGLLTQGESRMARRGPSARKIYDTARAALARLDQRPKTLCEMTHPGEPCPADQREGQR